MTVMGVITSILSYFPTWLHPYPERRTVFPSFALPSVFAFSYAVTNHVLCVKSAFTAFVGTVPSPELDLPCVTPPVAKAMGGKLWSGLQPAASFDRLRTGCG